MSTAAKYALDPDAPKDIERFWLKIFNDIQTDMRFVTMSHEHQGIYFNLLVLANNSFTVGRLHATRDDVARGLRISRSKLDKALAEFELKSMVFVEGSTIQIADERRYTGPGLNPSDSRGARAERVQKSRAKAREADIELQRVAATRNTDRLLAREDESSEDKFRIEPEEGNHFLQEENVEADAAPQEHNYLQIDDMEDIPLL